MASTLSRPPNYPYRHYHFCASLTVPIFPYIIIVSQVFFAFWSDSLRRCRIREILLLREVRLFSLVLSAFLISSVQYADKPLPTAAHIYVFNWFLCTYCTFFWKELPLQALKGYFARFTCISWSPHFPFRARNDYKNWTPLTGNDNRFFLGSVTTLKLSISHRHAL